MSVKPRASALERLGPAWTFMYRCARIQTVNTAVSELVVADERRCAERRVCLLVSVVSNLMHRGGLRWPYRPGRSDGFHVQLADQARRRKQRARNQEATTSRP